MTQPNVLTNPGELNSISKNSSRDHFPRLREFFQRRIHLIFGVLFLVTGVLKIAHPAPATMGLESLEVPFRAANYVIIVVTVLEIYLGLLMVFQVNLRFAFSVAMCMMFVFLVYLWYLTTLAKPPSCGCLGLTGIFQSTKTEAFVGVFRNCLILWGLHWALQNVRQLENNH
jgi:uncharacterized membrane protein YphA (DoxX/SURF4 family)